MALNFRKAQKSDLEEIIRMLSDDFLGKEREDFKIPLPKHYIEAFDEINNDPNNLLIVADHPDKKTVATMQLTFIPNLNRKGSKRMQIEAVRVDNAFRNQGIGAKMMEFAFKKGREQNCKIVQLTTDTSRDDARRFYERLGFEATHLGMKLFL